jgi:hypothetical protein
MPFFLISSPSSGNATQLQGRAVSATAPATGSILTWNGGSWLPGTGQTGATGPAGPDGAKFWSGTTGPLSGFGNSGDFFLDTNAGRLYGPKDSGVWGAGVLLTAGQQGATGPTGAAGSNGSNGATGATGATGVSGVTGPSGARGATILAGSGAPLNAYGLDGDWYIDTLGADFYGPKAGGAWGNATIDLLAITGPTGATPTTIAAGNVTGLATIATSGSASDLTTGTIATARLGSGTASSSTFLRGDQTFAAPPVTSVDGATGAVTVTKVEIYEFTRSTKPAAASGSGGSYTFSLPAGAKAVEFLAIGGGGGGGSGRRGAAGSARFGGGGGGGGNATLALVNASNITTAMTIVVGAGGAGGASVTSDDTNGNNGTTGGSSSVAYNSQTSVSASPGSGASGGTAAAGTSGGSSSNGADTWRNTAGTGSSSVSATAGSAFVSPGYAASGGAAGGGISTGNTAYNGGTQFLGSSQQSITGIVLTNQTGGNASTTAAGGNGPSGPNYGYGGNGGGASTNGFNSGAGGNGGEGFVRITVWF